MLDFSNPLVWFLLLGIIGAATFLVLRGRYSPEAVERRRRLRSHGRVVSKVPRPIISLAVKTKAEEKKKSR